MSLLRRRSDHNVARAEPVGRCPGPNEFGPTNLLCRDALDRRARRLRSAERRDQLGLLRLRRLEMALLDVAVAADLFGNAGELYRERVVVRREPRQQLVDQRLVVGDELALALAFRGFAEDVERGPAQAFHFREHPERAHHPWPVAALLGLARRRVGLVDQWGRQVEVKLVIALELR